jgi:hypothetical protein
MKSALAVVVLAACLGAPFASAQDAQPNRPKKQPPPVRQPTPAPEAPVDQPRSDTPAQSPKEERGEPEYGPYLEQISPKDWVLKVDLLVNSDSPREQIIYKDPFSERTVALPKITPFEFQTLAVVFPLVPSTGSSDPYPREVTGVLRLNDRIVDSEPEYMIGYPGGVRLARFDAGGAQTTSCRQVKLHLEVPMRCYNTRYDEGAALRVPWPSGPWPRDAASILVPQLFIETGIDASGAVRPYDDKILEEAMAKWLAEERISSPKGINPGALAKLITAKVWTAVQISGEGLGYKRTGELAGMEIMPPPWTLRDGRGSAHDVTALLTALLRKAGLPARVVIGWDVSEQDDKIPGARGRKERKLRSWVEFCLYDEAANTYNWIPIDLVRMRSGAARPPSLTQPWKYFGTHDELNSVAPISFHYHPPTDVASYGWPAFWGWFVTPKTPPAAEQAIRFSANIMSVRGGQPARDPKKQLDRPSDTRKGP